MNLARRKQIQQNLKDLGFYTGPVDGDFGRGTRSAIARYQESIGEKPTGVVTRQQLPAMLAASPAQGPDENGSEFGVASDETTVDGGAGETAAAASTLPDGATFYDPYNNADISRSDRRALARELVYRIARINPEMLRKVDAARSWMKLIASDEADPAQAEVARLYQTYLDGNEFEQEKALQTFTDLIAARATDAPLKIVRIRQVQLGRYDRDKGGFPIEGIRQGSYDFDREMTIGTTPFEYVNAEFQVWDPVALLPYLEDKAEAFIKSIRQNGMRSLDLAMTIVLEDFGPGTFGPAGAQARVSGITVHRVAGNSGNRLGPQLMSLDLGAEQPEGEAAVATGKPLEQWKALGATVSDGRLRMNAWENSLALQKPLLLLGIDEIEKSKGFENPAFIHYFTANYLGRTVYRALFPRGYEYAVAQELEADAFLKRDLVEAFKARHLPQLKAARPAMPVPARMVWPVKLSPYNFDRQAFPLSHGVDAGTSDNQFQVTMSMMGASTVTIHPDLKSLPAELAMKDDAARKLAAKLRKDPQKQLFAAFDVTLTKIDRFYVRNLSITLNDPMVNLNIAFAAEAGSMRIYEDEGLTREIASLPLETLRSKVVVPEQSLADGGVLPTVKLASSWSVLSLMEPLGAPAGFADTALRGMSDYRQASEFDRQAVLERLQARLRSETVSKDKPFHFGGEVTLGEYDQKAGAFPIENIVFKIAGSGSSDELRSDFFNLSAENQGEVTRLAVPVDRAKTLVKYGRVFPARIEVIPTRAVADGSNGERVRFDLLIRKVTLINPKSTERGLAVIEVAPKTPAEVAPALATVDTVALAKTPTHIDFDEEGLLLLVAKHGGVTLDDASMTYLMQARWTKEHDTYLKLPDDDQSPWGAFFPRNFRELVQDDLTRILPVFRRWTELRIAAFPDKLRVTRFVDERSQSVEGITTPLYGHTPLMELLGVERKNYGDMTSNSLSLLPGDAVVKGGLTGLRLSGQTVGMMRLADIPVPETLVGKVGAVRIEADLRKVHRLPEGQGPVALDLAPTAAKWYGKVVSAGDERSLLGESTLEAAPEIKPVAEISLDILGLKIGMSQAEAEATIAKAMTLDRILEIKGELQADPNIVPENARLYVNAEGTDFIAVNYGPISLDQAIIGVSRTLHVAEGSATEAQLLAALTNKYGPTDVVNRWGRSADLGHCNYAGGQNTIDWRGATVVKGPPVDMMAYTDAMASDPVRVREALTSRRLAYLDWAIGTPPFASDAPCTPVVIGEISRYTAGYAGENIPGASTLMLKTKLIDNLAHQKKLLEGKEALAANPPAIEVPDNVKL